MAKYVTKRLTYMIITLFLIASFTFFLMKMLPGSPISSAPKLSPEQLAVVEAKYGLDKPLPEQYLQYLGNVVKFDFGVSFQFKGADVTQLIINRTGPSFQLGIQALILGTIIGIILGMIAALKQNTAWDYGSTLIAIFGLSIPSFVFATLLQYWVGVKWEMLPVALWKDGFASSIMPTIALAIGPLAIAARFVRTEMVEVLSSDYILLAKAKGASRFDVAIKHAFRNALIPLITVMGPLAAGLVTGSLVVEQIFAIPGIGEQFVKSISMNDFPIIMGTTMFYSILLIVIIFIVDILYGIIDPRIRLAGGTK